MDEKELVKPKGIRGPKPGSNAKRYTFDERLRAVKLHLEEGFPLLLVCKETGVSASSLSLWLRQFRKQGELGLKGEAAPRPGRRLPAPVIEKIVELKRSHRWYGVKRISDSLKRLFFLQASAETVRRTLHEAEMMDKPPKARRNLTRPRFFERATPNQMWQSDIFTFRLGGKYAYVVAFMDDYSRYVVNLDLFRSPTAEAVIETYRVAVGEYSPPKEMLTDRGRQYTNWRGKSRFAVELTKDRVAHLVSRPQHPMTLGKVERFWATMWQDFLVRAQFDSFESARERLKLWVKYYNHRRPHQGIGSMCPADRYFEIQSEMKKTIQAGIQENLLEMALRGAPKAPFYLVGRMEGQSVVLKAEKGKLKLSVNDKEMTYELEKGNGCDGEEETNEDAEPGILGSGEGTGGLGRVDGAREDGAGAKNHEHKLHLPAAVAGPGDGGDAAGPGNPGEPVGRGGLEPPAQGPLAEAPTAGRPGETARPAGAAAGDCLAGPGPVRSLNHEHGQWGASTRRDDRESAGRSNDRPGGGGCPRGIQEDVLRMGEEGPDSDAPELGGKGSRPASPSREPQREGTRGEGGRTYEGAGGGQADLGNPGDDPAHGRDRG